MNFRLLMVVMAALVLGAPVQAETYDEFRAWCYDDATDDRKIEGCSALIAANREAVEGIATAYYKRGNAHRNKRQTDRALEDYGVAIRLKPDYVAAFHNRALVYEELDDYPRAIADFDQAISIWPEFVFGIVHRGNAYEAMGKSERAFLDFDRVIGLQPTYAEACSAGQTPITASAASTARSRT